MKFWRGGASFAYYSTMIAGFIAIVVAAVFNVLSTAWATVASTGPAILIALYAGVQAKKGKGQPEDVAAAIVKDLLPRVLAARVAEMPKLGLDTDHRIRLRWQVAEGSNPTAQRDAGLADSGTLDQLIELIGRQADSGGLPRLVVTGVMGGGKTAACSLLIVELAKQHGRLPVFLHLATWDPGTQLQDWIMDQLPDVVPGVAKSKYGRQVAKYLAERHILPILDSLDSMQNRSAALRAIDDQMSGRPFVLTCRTAEFQEASAGHLLHQALIVDLQPLRAEEVRDILLEYEPASARGPLSTVVAALQDDPAGPVAEALNTPLMVSLARTAGASVADLGAVVPGPGAADAIRRHLLGTFLRRAYAEKSQHERDRIQRHLKFLAKHTDHTGRIAWWMLYEAIPFAVQLIVAIVIAAAVCSGLAALAFAFFRYAWPGFWIGLSAGSIGAVIVTLVPQQEPRRAQPRLRSLRVPEPIELVRIIGFGVMGGAATAVIVYVLYGQVRYIVIGGVFSGVSYAVASYIGQPNDEVKVVTPGGLLRADRMTVLAAWLVSALAGALSGGFLGLAFPKGHRHRPMFHSLALLHYPPLVLMLLGAAGGAALAGTGLGLMAMGSSSWGRFILVRVWLAFRGSVPRRLMSFLDDAYKERGILRQVNGYYEFRHQILQRYLDEPDPELAAGALASPAAPS